MSWIVKKLGDVLDIQNGYAFDSKLFSNEGGMPLIRIRDIKNGFGTQTMYTGEYDNKYVVRKGDLLIGMDGEFGCYEWKDRDALLNQRVCRLQNFQANILPKFLLYGINSYLKAIEDVTSYTTVKHISSKQIANIDFPLPSVEIQQKIVSKLDAIFAEIDKATAASEANAENAEALFQSYLTELFERGGEGWVERLTGDVCIKITDGKHGDCVNEDNSGYYFLSAKDIKNGNLNYKGSRQITKKDFEETHRRTNLECGDVLVTNSGTIGRMAIAMNDEKTTKTTFQKSVAILKPKADNINSKFLFHLLTSKLLHFNNISAGAAQKNLLLRDIRSLKIKFPTDLSEQIKVSNGCDFMREKTNHLVNYYKNKNNEINLLRQSILQQAFNGELVKD